MSCFYTESKKSPNANFVPPATMKKSDCMKYVASAQGDCPEIPDCSESVLDLSEEGIEEMCVRLLNRVSSLHYSGCKVVDLLKINDTNELTVLAWALKSYMRKDEEDEMFQAP